MSPAERPMNPNVRSAPRRAPPTTQGVRGDRRLPPLPEAAMVYVDLFESRLIAMFAYDLDTRSLLIRFKSGEFYAYLDVPRGVFDDFRQTPSKGQFFQAAIRGRFVSRRLSASEMAAIARGQGYAAASGVAPGARVDIAALERSSKTVFF